jgi:hypothetical protein
MNINAINIIRINYIYLPLAVFEESNEVLLKNYLINNNNIY